MSPPRKLWPKQAIVCMLALFFFNCNEKSRVSFQVEVHEYNIFNDAPVCSILQCLSIAPAIPEQVDLFISFCFVELCIMHICWLSIGP